MELMANKKSMKNESCNTPIPKYSFIIIRVDKKNITLYHTDCILITFALRSYLATMKQQGVDLI